MMQSAATRKRLMRVALGAMLGAAVLIGDMGRSARAEDDDAPDVKILRNILKTLGLRSGDEAGIDYRERSPLVVPPSRNLVPPATAKGPESNPAWPNDPDVKRKKEAKTKRNDQRRYVDWDVDSRALSPSALRGNNPAPGAQGQPQPNNADLAGALKPSELGYKGNLFSNLFGAPKEEYAPFTGEAPRTSLIEPPPGYRTPSPSQPYGVGREKWTPPKVDRHEPIR